MNNGKPTGEVRPMIDREPPNAAETRGASVRTRFCESSGLVRALGALSIALERRIVGFQKPATGESRVRCSRGRSEAARATPNAPCARLWPGPIAVNTLRPQRSTVEQHVRERIAIWRASGRIGHEQLKATPIYCPSLSPTLATSRCSALVQPASSAGMGNCQKWGTRYD
jgi:hypothetical protein